MNVSREQADKIIVGGGDVSFPDGGPDVTPTGTAILNGPVYVGKPSAAPGYEGVLNVSSNSAPQSALDRQPPCQADLAIQCDGNMVIRGDNKTSKALKVNGDTETIGDAHVTGNVSTGGDVIIGSIDQSVKDQSQKSFKEENAYANLSTGIDTYHERDGYNQAAFGVG